MDMPTCLHCDDRAMSLCQLMEPLAHRFLTVRWSLICSSEKEEEVEKSSRPMNVEASEQRLRLCVQRSYI